MTQYVNTEAFFRWYRSVAKETPRNEEDLLTEVFRQYCSTRREEFVLLPEQTKSGREERISLHLQHMNCCGADRTVLSFLTD